MSIVLRDYQVDLRDRARALMRQGVRRLLLQLPTGGGKTALTADMMKTSASRGMDSFFIVHRRELIKQSVRTFDKVGVHHGVVSAGFVEDAGPRVQIAGVASLVNRVDRYRKPRLIVWDEAHHLAAGSWSKIFRSYPDAFHIGLTATPERLDGKGLGDYFQELLVGPSTGQLIEQGHLSRFKAYAPPGVNLDGLHTRMGDFVKSELAAVVGKPSITGNAVAEYRKRAAGKRNVVFCFSIEHSQSVVAEYTKQGFRARHVDGESDPHYRDESIQMFEAGDLDILSNVDLFGEGFDLPAIECVQLLRPTQSLGLYLQQVGRALRPSPGKEFATILDHVKNIENHGLPDEAREWSLEGREQQKKKDNGPGVKICAACFAAQLPGSPVCRYCGTPFETMKREVEQQDGELDEIDPRELAARRARRQRGFEQHQSQSLEDLIALGKKRGYKKAEAWAKHVFNSRQVKKLRGE